MKSSQQLNSIEDSYWELAHCRVDSTVVVKNFPLFGVARTIALSNYFNLIYACWSMWPIVPCWLVDIKPYLWLAFHGYPLEQLLRSSDTLLYLSFIRCSESLHINADPFLIFKLPSCMSSGVSFWSSRLIGTCISSLIRAISALPQGVQVAPNAVL